jgi:hypothetical protein
VSPSYHDLYITTPTVERTSISDLPFRVRVSCCRVAGWQVWAHKENPWPEELLGGEYDLKWLVLDVNGHEIVNSRDREREE